MRFFQIVFIAVFNIQIVNCDREVADETWIVEWTFIDTITQIEQINYTIDMMTDKPRYNRHGNRLLDSMGILHEAFNSIEKEDFNTTIYPN